MNRTLKYTLLSLLWGAVAVYIIWAAASARRARSERKVGRVDIEVVDSTAQGHLVSVGMVRRWISESGISTVGTAVDAVDLAGIERLIARNGLWTGPWFTSPTTGRSTSPSASASRLCAC